MANLNSELPKYLALKEYIKEKILQGEIRYGDRILSEHELAQQLNLSRHTVRQALAQLGNEGWIYKEQGKGTFCSYIKDGNKGKTVAVLTTYISDYIFPKIISGIEEVLSYNGYNMLLANTNNDKQKEEKHIENLLNQDISGIIIEPTKSALANVNYEMLKTMENKNIKIAYINSYYDNPEGSYLVMDDEKGGYIATKYLIDIGHERFAAIFKSDDIQGINREKGFIKALNEHGLDVEKNMIGKYDTNNKSGFPQNFVRKLIKADKLPTAVVCYNDEIALKVIDTLMQEGIRVPEDVSVVGYDDSTLSTASQIKLTTIKHPKKDMGKQAAGFIIDMIEGSDDKPTMVYEPELVVRNSCQSILKNS